MTTILERPTVRGDAAAARRLVLALRRDRYIGPAAARTYWRALPVTGPWDRRAVADALLLLSANPDLRASTEGLALLAVWAPGALRGEHWRDLCDKADEAERLTERGGLDAYLDPREQRRLRDAGDLGDYRAEIAGHLESERRVLAAWLACGGDGAKVLCPTCGLSSCGGC